MSFLAGAILPVTIMAGVSFRAVTEQLGEQSRDRLDLLSKSTGMAAMERVTWAREVADRLARDPGIDGASALPAGVNGIEVLAGDRVVVSRGRVSTRPTLDPSVLDALSQRPVVRMTTDGAPADLLLGVAHADPGTVVWVRFEADSLLTRALAMAELPTTAGVCVLGPGYAPLACDLEWADELAAAVAGQPPGRGVSEIRVGGERHLAAAWEVFLPSVFDAESWWVVVSESRASIYAPLRAFRWSFPLALTLGVAIIGLLASVQIRRTLDPLGQLTAGTERVARGELDGRVEVASNDEFADLAVSFNAMADQLEGRFALLAAGKRIDETSLAAFDYDRIVGAFLESCRTVFPRRRVAVVRTDESGGWRIWGALDPAGSGGRVAWAPRAPQLRACAEAAAEADVFEADGGAVGDLTYAGFEAADLPVTLVPLRASGRTVGALALGGREGHPPDERALADALILVRHAALGVNGAGLVSDLEDMSWGTIRAMARAVDAKSPWTAGHSERVTVLGLALGRQLGLNEADLLLMERGGLLHDLGKIGVPASILDHPGGLTEEQFGIMKRHPVIGTEILQPIKAFAPILPLVRSHHERWDGSGYPDGLAGTDIHPLARILAVADVFDAMVSDRPYRSSMDVDLVHSIIRKGVGTSFAPEPVSALTAVLEQGWSQSEPTLEGWAHV